MNKVASILLALLMWFSQTGMYYMVADYGGSSTTDYTQDANILGAWLLDGNSNDELGNNNGTDAGVTYSAGKYGQAADFDGNNDEIDLGDVTFLDGLSALTNVFWIKTPNDSGTRATIKKDGCWIPLQFDTADNWRMGIWDSVGISFNEAQSPGLVDDTWHHIAVTWDKDANSGIPIFYKDGEVVSLDTSDGQTEVIANSTDTMNFGNSSALDEDLDGLMDEVAFFSRVLSQAEIQEIMNNGLKGDQ